MGGSTEQSYSKIKSVFVTLQPLPYITTDDQKDLFNISELIEDEHKMEYIKDYFEKVKGLDISIFNKYKSKIKKISEYPSPENNELLHDKSKKTKAKKVGNPTESKSKENKISKKRKRKDTGSSEQKKKSRKTEK